MASMKLALIVLLALGAVQCQGATLSELEPEPRDLDVFLAAQNAIKIVRNVIAAVEKGIQDSKPSIDILIQQLTPELGSAIRGVIDKALGLVKKEKERIEFMIKEVEQLLDAIKKIKVCTDPEKKNLEKVLAKFENGVLEAVRTTLKNQQNDIEDTKVGFYKLLNWARKLFDDEIKNVIECIKPKHPNAQKCIQDEIEKTKEQVTKLATNIFMFFEEISDTVTMLLAELLERVPPHVETFKKEINPVMKNISDCIAKMK